MIRNRKLQFNSSVKETLPLDDCESTNMGVATFSEETLPRYCKELELLLDVEICCCC